MFTDRFKLWKELRRIFVILPDLLVHYYDNVIMIPSPTPCPTTTPTHNLVTHFGSAAWGILALVCFAHGALTY